MSLFKLSHIAFLVLFVATLAAADSTPATYQKGTITEATSSPQKSYALKNGNVGYQISNCGDFQTGQTVEYRVKDRTVYIRREGGTEYKCSIKAELTINSDPSQAPVWQTGKILGYESLFRSSRGTGGIRRANVYELRGPDLIYLIDFCGAFQAGQFETGQVVDFGVDADRLYIRHDNNKEYNCQIDGKQKPEDAQATNTGAQTVAAVPTAAPVPATAKLSIVSIPDGADIEVDGNFAGNTPSDLAVPDGEHAITVRKSGYKNWERKMKVVAGSNIRLSAELEKTAAP